MLIDQPFRAASREGQYDVVCTVKGGGLSGQAGAVRHGISKALSVFEPALRPVLKKGGFLTRDARVVERKKYGKRKARRSFQFSKRCPEPKNRSAGVFKIPENTGWPGSSRVATGEGPVTRIPVTLAEGVRRAPYCQRTLGGP